MNVLHLSFRDNAGGSGRAAYRLHRSLQARGFTSRMLVARRSTKDADVQLITFGLLKKLDDLCGAISRPLALDSVFYPSSFALKYRPWFREADVIQIYNTHGGYLSHTAFPGWSRERPLVWRLSDMWAFTGHCAYSYECERWKTGCGACPHLDNPYLLARDSTALLWKIKKAVYARSKLTIVAPSQWMAECVKASPLLGHFTVRLIPNGIDTALFHPMRRAAREVLGLDPDKKLILFGAELVTQERKGVKYFIEALERLDPVWRGKIAVLLVGLGSDRLALPPGFEAKRFGMVNDDRLVAAIYAAADITVMTTLADNLPNALLEALACGTPAVAFKIGGVPDAVRHLETGWLAAPRSAEEVATGLETLLEDDALRGRLGVRAREVAVSEYTLELQAGRFAALYEGVVSNS